MMTFLKNNNFNKLEHLIGSVDVRSPLDFEMKKWLNIFQKKWYGG